MTLAKSPAPHSGQSVTMRPSRRRRMRPPSVPGAMTRLLLFPRPVDEQLFASPERKAQSEGFGLSVRVERAQDAPHGAAIAKTVRDWQRLAGRGGLPPGARPGGGGGARAAAGLFPSR